MVYFVNTMSSMRIYRQDFYKTIFEGYIKSIDFESGDMTVSCNILDDKIVPWYVKDSAGKVVAEIKIDSDTSERHAISETFELKDIDNVFEKVAPAIEEAFPKPLNETCFVLEDTLNDGINQNEIFQSDKFQTKAIKKIKSLKNTQKLPYYAVIIDKPLFPKNIQNILSETGADGEIVNFVRNPIINYVIDSYNNSEDMYSGVKYMQSSNINSMTLSMLYNETMPEITTNIRYEDYIFLDSLDIKNVTIIPNLKPANAYLSTSEKGTPNISGVLDEKLALVEEFTDAALNTRELYSNKYLPEDYQNSEDIIGYLENYTKYPFIDCIAWENGDEELTEKQQEQIFNMSVEASKSYNELKNTFENISKTNFFKFFKYNIKLDLNSILYNN